MVCCRFSTLAGPPSHAGPAAGKRYPGIVDHLNIIISLQVYLKLIVVGESNY